MSRPVRCRVPVRVRLRADVLRKRPDESLREEASSQAQAALGEDRYDDLVDACRTLSLDEAIMYALTGEGAHLPA